MRQKQPHLPKVVHMIQRGSTVLPGIQVKMGCVMFKDEKIQANKSTNSYSENIQATEEARYDINQNVCKLTVLAYKSIQSKYINSIIFFLN